MNRWVKLIPFAFLGVLLAMYVQLAVSRAANAPSVPAAEIAHHMQIIYSEPDTVFFTEFYRGARRAEEELDIYVEFVEADKWELQGVTYGVRKSMYAGVEGTAFSLSDPERIRGLLDIADDQQAQLLLYQSDQEQAVPIPTVGADPWQTGYQAGLLALEAAGGEARVAVVLNSTVLAETSAQGSRQLQGVSDALATAAGAAVAGVYPLKSDVMKGQRMASTLLTQAEDFDVIICLDEVTTPLLAQRLADDGREDLPLVGCGALPLTLDYIGQGVIYASLCPDADAIGYDTVKTMYRCLTARQESGAQTAVPSPPPAELVTIDRGNLDQFVGLAEVGE